MPTPNKSDDSVPSNENKDNNAEEVESKKLSQEEKKKDEIDINDVNPLFHEDIFEEKYNESKTDVPINISQTQNTKTQPLKTPDTIVVDQKVVANEITRNEFGTLLKKKESAEKIVFHLTQLKASVNELKTKEDSFKKYSLEDKKKEKEIEDIEKQLKLENDNLLINNRNRTASGISDKESIQLLERNEVLQTSINNLENKKDAKVHAKDLAVNNIIYPLDSEIRELRKKIDEQKDAIRKLDQTIVIDFTKLDKELRLRQATLDAINKKIREYEKITKQKLSSTPFINPATNLNSNVSILPMNQTENKNVPITKEASEMQAGIDNPKGKQRGENPTVACDLLQSIANNEIWQDKYCTKHGLQSTVIGEKPKVSAMTFHHPDFSFNVTNKSVSTKLPTGESEKAKAGPAFVELYLKGIEGQVKCRHTIKPVQGSKDTEFLEKELATQLIALNRGEEKINNKSCAEILNLKIKEEDENIISNDNDSEDESKNESKEDSTPSKSFKK